MELILHDVICSLSSSLDLVGVTDVHHGQRVALIAATIAEHLGWDKERELDMLYANVIKLSKRADKTRICRYG